MDCNTVLHLLQVAQMSLFRLTLLEELKAVEDSTSNGFPVESWSHRIDVARGRDVTVHTIDTLRSPSCAYASSQNTFGGSEIMMK